jgi:LTXXQ motif family protein
MTVRKPLVLLAAILAASATAALAQTSASPPAATGTPSPTTQGMPMQGMPMGSMPGASGGMPMMGMMQMMMGQSGMAGHVEGRIAFLKTELKITDAQLPLWNAVADAIRTTAKDMAGMPNGMSMMQSMMQSSGTLPEKLAAREKTMAAHLEALRKLKAAVEPLYPALSDDQKKTADQLMIGPMGMMSMGMM